MSEQRTQLVNYEATTFISISEQRHDFLLSAEDGNYISRTALDYTRYSLRGVTRHDEVDFCTQ